jgi:hypothetical protein
MKQQSQQKKQPKEERRCLLGGVSRSGLGVGACLLHRRAYKHHTRIVQRTEKKAALLV